MPYLETPDELAELLADRMGAYGAHNPECDGTDNLRRGCRMCWVDELADRIRQAVANETVLEGGKR